MSGVKKRGRPTKGPGGKPKTKGYNYVPKAEKERIARAVRVREQRRKESTEIVLESWQCRVGMLSPAPAEAARETIGSNRVSVRLPGNAEEITNLEHGMSVCYGEGNSLFNVGGLVQAISWAPKRWKERNDGAKDCEKEREKESIEMALSEDYDYIAVSANVDNENGLHSHVLGSTYRGWHALQLWAVPSPATERAPFLAMALLHQAACVYTIAWCPLSAALLGQESSQSVISRMGILGACMGDGALALFAIPMPQHAAKLLGVEAPALACLEPLMHVCHEGEHFVSLDWHVQDKVVSLAVGTATGHLALWKFAADGGVPEREQEPLFRVRLTQGPLRQLSFCPEDANFLVCSSAWGKARVVDLRRPCTEVASHTMGNVSMAAKWCQGGLGILAGASNSLSAWANSQVSHLHWHKDVIWAIDYGIEDFGVTASDDGVVCLFKVVGQTTKGSKTEAFKLATLHVETLKDTKVLFIAHPFTLYACKKPSKAEALSHDWAVVRSVSIGSSRRRRVAYGGGAGLVFCKSLDEHFPPL